MEDCPWKFNLIVNKFSPKTGLEGARSKAFQHSGAMFCALPLLLAQYYFNNWLL